MKSVEIDIYDYLNPIDPDLLLDYLIEEHPPTVEGLEKVISEMREEDIALAVVRSRYSLEPKKVYAALKEMLEADGEDL